MYQQSSSNITKKGGLLVFNSCHIQFNHVFFYLLVAYLSSYHEKAIDAPCETRYTLRSMRYMVVAQTLVIFKKVRTRQSFCAHKLQKIRGNIDPDLGYSNCNLCVIMAMNHIIFAKEAGRI